MGKKVRVEKSEIVDNSENGEEDECDTNADHSGQDGKISIFSNITKKPFNYSVVKTTEENDEDVKETELSILNREENRGDDTRPVAAKETKSCRKRTFGSIVSELQLTIIG